MSHSDSEEQLQEITSFLAKTWKIIVAIIIIGLLIFWGWRYWQSHKIETMTSLSDQYESLIAKLDSNDAKSIDPVVTFAKQNDNIYGVFASLKAAQFYVNTLKDYASAESLLLLASKNTSSDPVLAIINIRIARLQYQLEKYEESLKTLDKVTGNKWTAMVNNIRGDVLVKMGKYQEACNAYEVALASNPTPILEKNINMKLNQTNYLQQQALQQEKTAKENVEVQTTNGSLSPEK